MGDDVELQIRSYFDQGDLTAAATAAMKRYGPEIFAFLSACHHGGDDADEVFSLFAENLWKSLSTFGWQSTFRTWAYGIARRTSLRYRRDEHRRHRRQQPLPEQSTISDLVAQVRSTTAPHLRSENKDRIAELRATLPPEDQELLMLRVDRKLSWMDLAEVLHDPDALPLDHERRKREAARLRKRFQIVKDRLRELARAQGLIGAEDES